MLGKLLLVTFGSGQRSVVSGQWAVGSGQWAVGRKLPGIGRRINAFCANFVPVGDKTERKVVSG